MSERKWILEVYQATSAGDNQVISLEFESLPQLRLALTTMHDHKFIVEIPSDATAADRNTLLDMRAQGFDIATRPARTM